MPINGAGSSAATRTLNTVAASRPRGKDVRIVVSQQFAGPLLRLLDQLALTAALFFTVLSYYLKQPNDGGITGFLTLRVSMRNLLIELVLLAAWRLVFWMMGLYHLRLIRGISSFLWRVPLTVIPCTAVLIPVLMSGHSDRELMRSCMLFWFTGTTFMLSSRAALFTWDEQVRPMLRRRRSVIICGTGLRARALAFELATHPDFRYQLLGFIDSAPQSACDRMAPLLGAVDEMESVLMRLPVDEVMIALPVKSHFETIEEIVAICGRAGVQTQYSLDIFTTDIAKTRKLENIDGNRVVLQMVNQDHRLYLKGFVDRAIAGLGLFLLSPLLLAVAIAIKLTSNGPIFFVQQRFGLNKRKFGMIKFRSMVVDAEARQAALEHLNEVQGPTFKIKADPRITGIGKFIRRTSIDELPQLFNVLRGDMSLVGPRPLPTRDVERFSEAWLMRRFSVKPGITGLWQVSGRSNTDFDNAIKLDLRYIDKWSLALDFKILARTLSAVVRGSGAY
jgi:exopolysaccharide biosynthesis polyprenyl glycosylphosphotransferase